MSELYRCPICKQIHSNGGSCYDNAVKRIKQLEAEVKNTQDAVDTYSRENQRLKRRFPMIDGSDIDWITAEKMYEMYSYLYGRSQSLERLAERGGYYWAEIAPMTLAYMNKKALEGKDG